MQRHEVLERAKRFAEDLTNKDGGRHGYVYELDRPGRRFVRITQQHRSSFGRRVHAFVELDTGKLCKPATFTQPAKWGTELASHWSLADTDQYTEALAAAEYSGGYLYKR